MKWQIILMGCINLVVFIGSKIKAKGQRGFTVIKRIQYLEVLMSGD